MTTNVVIGIIRVKVPQEQVVFFHALLDELLMECQDIEYSASFLTSLCLPVGSCKSSSCCCGQWALSELLAQQRTYISFSCIAIAEGL